MQTSPDEVAFRHEGLTKWLSQGVTKSTRNLARVSAFAGMRAHFQQTHSKLRVFLADLLVVRRQL